VAEEKTYLPCFSHIFGQGKYLAMSE